MSAICKTCRHRSIIGSTINKTWQQGLLKQATPHIQEGPRRGVRWWYAALVGLAALELRHHSSRAMQRQWKTRSSDRWVIEDKKSNRCVFYFLTIVYLDYLIGPCFSNKYRGSGLIPIENLFQMKSTNFSRHWVSFHQWHLIQDPNRKTGLAGFQNWLGRVLRV